MILGEYTPLRFVAANLTPAARLAAWNFFWMVLGRVVGQAARVGVVLLLTHHLTQDQFGMFVPNCRNSVNLINHKLLQSD
ncbi:MAG: hypothetical protein WHT09_02450 [Thermogutta sp.]